jgi:hypothetical protein
MICKEVKTQYTVHTIKGMERSKETGEKIRICHKRRQA